MRPYNEKMQKDIYVADSFANSLIQKLEYLLHHVGQSQHVVLTRARIRTFVYTEYNNSPIAQHDFVHLVYISSFQTKFSNTRAHNTIIFLTSRYTLFLLCHIVFMH